MGLKYKFRHLFYGAKIHKDRLYSLLEDLDERIEDLEEQSKNEGSDGG